MKDYDEVIRKKNNAVFDTADNTKEQVEYLKSISEKYDNIIMQNELQSARLKEISDKYDSIIKQNEQQTDENGKTKLWTIIGVVIMSLTLLVAILTLCITI